MLLVVGQEYRPPFWGHVFMFGMRDHLISPFTTGYEGTAIESLYPTNTDMFRKARSQGAYVGYVHAFAGEADPLAGNLGAGKGFMVDAALGTTDAVEWSAAGRSGFFPLYAVWNNGLKVSAVGGEDSISNLHMSKLVGSHRTYVHTGGKGLDMHAWLDGMRQGRAFVTNGPLVELSVNGMLPGETINLPAGWRACARRGPRAIHRSAPEGDTVLQRTAGRRDSAQRRPKVRGPRQDADGVRPAAGTTFAPRARRPIGSRSTPAIHRPSRIRSGSSWATVRSATVPPPSTR